MLQFKVQNESEEPYRRPEWLQRLFDKKEATGGAPDFEAGQAAWKRLEAVIARTEPYGFQSDEEIDAFIDASGLKKCIVEDWPVVPWSYWEARGAGPYRR